MNVKGVAALITGGGSGLGAETARVLAAQGAKVELRKDTWNKICKVLEGGQVRGEGPREERRVEGEGEGETHSS